MLRYWYDRGYDALLDYALTNKPAARRLVVTAGVSLGSVIYLAIKWFVQ